MPLLERVPSIALAWIQMWQLIRKAQVFFRKGAAHQPEGPFSWLRLSCLFHVAQRFSIGPCQAKNN